MEIGACLLVVTHKPRGKSMIGNIESRAYRYVLFLSVLIVIAAVHCLVPSAYAKSNGDLIVDEAKQYLDEKGVPYTSIEWKRKGGFWSSRALFIHFGKTDVGFNQLVKYCAIIWHNAGVVCMNEGRSVIIGDVYFSGAGLPHKYKLKTGDFIRRDFRGYDMEVFLERVEKVKE